MRPKVLDFITGILICINFCQPVFLSDNQGNSIPLTFLFGFMAIAFAILYFFWCGKNWARLAILVASVVVLPGPFMASVYGSLGTLLAIIEAIVGLFLLYWLNTKNVKEYFKG